MKTIVFRNATLVNENEIYKADLVVSGELISSICRDGYTGPSDEDIDADGMHLLPGVIDDQVHFREPGLSYKADIFSESGAAAAGGVTSFMEMPNTNPSTTNAKELANKFNIAKNNSYVNHSFFFGATNDNLEDVLKVNPKEVCGIKIFMGSSTGNMLVDDEDTLRGIFKNSPMLIATHCEVEGIVRANTEAAIEKYGEDIPIEMHPIIRSREACYNSSNFAIGLAKEYNTRLHILHISTEDELALFNNSLDRNEKRITSEVCVHHLSFNSSDYANKGTLIKCNPAIKDKSDQDALWDALNSDVLDIIATDHAPHTWEEKQNKYLTAPSGLPLVQHTLIMMLDHVEDGRIALEKVIDKMCHAPADIFKIEKRGYLREGYYADLVLVNLNEKYYITKENILYKCAWSPLEGNTYNASVKQTWVNGNLVYKNNSLLKSGLGQRLTFDH